MKVSTLISVSSIPSGERHLCGHWRSPLGQCPSWFPFAAHFDAHDPRRLKMPVLAKTSLSNSLTTLSVSSSGFRFTLGSHQLRL